MGRPSKYTQELVQAIAERLSNGEPLAQICRDEGMPDPSTVRDWMATREDVSHAIARAREEGFDQIALDALRIADEECTMVRADKHPGVKSEGVADLEVVFDATAVARNRLRVDTRLKLLAKWDPKRYGDRITTEHQGQVTLTHEQFLDNLE